MQLDARKKLNMVKAMLIALIILCVGMSFLDCLQGTAGTLNGIDGTIVTATYKQNNVSVWAFVFAGFQILLIWKNCFGLQVIPGILSSAHMILLPLMVKIISELQDLIVYIREPTGQSAVKHWVLTPIGYVYVAMGWLLLAASVFVAWWARKQKTLLEAEDKSTQEGAEVL